MLQPECQTKHCYYYNMPCKMYTIYIPLFKNVTLRPLLEDSQQEICAHKQLIITIYLLLGRCCTQSPLHTGCGAAVKYVVTLYYDLQWRGNYLLSTTQKNFASK